jgi:two-component system LytT family response regulator
MTETVARSTPPLTAVLVDDEELALRRLERLLEATGRVDVVNRFTDAVEAVAFLRRRRIDVLFLDIEMPDMNGFELLAKLDEAPLVIFTTAYEQYALRAFEVHSIDYLLKPIEARQLQRAVAKLDRLREGALQRDWHALAQRLAGPAAYPRRLMSHVGDRTELIDLADVTHFITAEKVTYAVGQARKQIVDHTLAELEQRLDPGQFVRIHRSILVNVSFVDAIEQRAGRVPRVRLRDVHETQLPVARQRVRELKERLVR